ncbi:MAG: AMP-binding protein [Armatimonadota bacterium]|nr:AMP-binding protein [Armatimonadota bacterium]
MSHGDYPNRAAIEAGQLARLRTLLQELIPANPFYARKLATANLTPEIASLEEFSRRVPFTTKQEIVEDHRAHPPYGSNLTYPLECYTRFNQTSATTGLPLRWLDTTESWNWMLDCWDEVYEAAGVRRGDRIYFAFSFGPFLGFWTAFEAGTRRGCLCVPGGGLSSVARVQAIIDNGISILCCTPTYAIRLAEVALSGNIDLTLAKVKTIIVAGEPGGSILATRAHIANLWPGARVFDHHGMTEIGPVTYECPQRPGVLHVIESAYYPEIIDPYSRQPVAPGGTGELILTNLGRWGSPLLRYRTGDVVRRAAANPCACGRYDLALEGGILGRTDDMVVVRGVNIFPGAVEDVLRTCPEVAEYRVEIRTYQALPELSIQIEPVPGCVDVAGLVHQLESVLRSTFALRIPVTAVPAGTLPRFEMKARRWVKL